MWRSTRPGGLTPDQIRTPAKLWHGEDDAFVPVGHGRWLAGRVSGSELVPGTADGHMTVVADRIAEVHGWLAARF